MAHRHMTGIITTGALAATLMIASPVSAGPYVGTGPFVQPAPDEVVPAPFEVSGK